MEESNLIKGKLYETTIQINDIDFKNFVIELSKIAQNSRDVASLSVLKTYEFYLDRFKKFFMRKYEKKPKKCDNLAFILLLTYPEYKIIEFKSVKDIKISFNDPIGDSDFESTGFHEGEDITEHTCVCNTNILYVHRFCNKYSGITINIGSDCNELYGLISPSDPKFKEHMENEKERKEGKPQGFYKNQRAMKKLRKEEEKLRKEEEKNMKILEREIKSLNKPYGTKVYESRKCVLCEKCIIYNTRDCEIQICSNCSKNEQRKEKKETNEKIKNIKMKECLGCDKKSCFIKNEFCKECHKICKINRCEMCPERFISELISSDLYCPPCEENIIKCIDCKNVDVFKNKTMRCYKCDFKFINKIITKKCVYCDDEFDVDKENKWMTYCKDCRKKGHHQKKTISKICQHCNDKFDIDQKYKKINKFCRTCYFKIKIK